MASCPQLLDPLSLSVPFPPVTHKDIYAVLIGGDGELTLGWELKAGFSLAPALLTHWLGHDRHLHFDLDDGKHDGAVVSLGQHADYGTSCLLDLTVVRLFVLLERLQEK